MRIFGNNKAYVFIPGGDPKELLTLPPNDGVAPKAGGAPNDGEPPNFGLPPNEPILKTKILFSCLFRKHSYEKQKIPLGLLNAPGVEALWSLALNIPNAPWGDEPKLNVDEKFQ